MPTRDRLPGGARVDVFAVEDRSLQVSWGSLPRREVWLEVAGRVYPVDSSPPPWYRRYGRRRVPADLGGPGALTVDGLEPGAEFDVLLSAPGIPRCRVATARTLPEPPGRLLTRFATVSDCHIGEEHFGPARMLKDPSPRPPGLEPYTVRCTKAAIAEAEAWGARTLVAKGDLTQDGKLPEIEDAVGVLRSGVIPVEAVLGNHDVRGPTDAAAELSARGIAVSRQPRAVDLDGVRLVLGYSPIRGRHSGRVSGADIDAMAVLAGAAPGPTVVVVHHPLQRWPVETHYPPSVSWEDSVRLASQVALANPSTLLIAGHTHRNRRYRTGGITVAEVGSPKDYPGQWAGYAVYEGGIRQVVRRVERPDAIAWTQMTGRALGGIWGWWSPGRLGDRCWTLEWPDRVVAARRA